MRPVSTTTFRPEASILVQTPRGDIFTDEILSDAIAFNTTKTLAGPTGTFALTLTARTGKDGSWADRIPPMSYVEIRGTATGKRNPDGSLPIIMRGFVDSVEQDWSIGQTGGPERSVIITGEDVTKILAMWMVKYVWQTDPTAAMTGAKVGLSLNYGIPILTCTPSAFVEAVNTHMVKPPISQLQRTMTHVPQLAVHATVPERFAFNLFAVQAYTGSYWDLLAYAQSPPLGECFIYDAEEGPVLVFRVAPLEDEHGNIASPAVEPELGPVSLDLLEVSSTQLGKSDNEALTYFFVWSDVAGITGPNTMPMYVSKGRNGTFLNPQILPDLFPFYGFRPLDLDTPWVTPLDVTGRRYEPAEQVQQAAELAKYLIDTQGHNYDLVAGTITAHGHEQYIVGRYLDIPERNQRFYIESVTHSFAFIGAPQPKWTTTLGVTRGRVHQIEQA